MMTTLCDVLPLLVEHLSLGDMGRLTRACHNHQWEHDVIAVVSSRMLRRRVLVSWGQVNAVMCNGLNCRECGIRTRCRPAVCGLCASDEDSYYAMDTRKTVLKRYGRINKHLKVIKRGTMGRFYYWKREVDELMQSL